VKRSVLPAEESTSVAVPSGPGEPGAPGPALIEWPLSDPSTPPSKAEGEKKAAKRRKKERKKLLDASRPLTSWERYRALRDAFNEGLELVDLADHKARFAFVIMGALNVALFFLGTRGEIMDLVAPGAGPWLTAYLVLYGLVGVGSFLQAIEALRPRSVRPELPPGVEIDDQATPAGVRFFHDVLRRDLGEHLRAWREIHIGQLNAEIARQAYALARINQLKYAALRRLYVGLKAMILMAAGLLMVLGFAAMRGAWWPDPPASTAVESEETLLHVPSAPRSVPDPGVREPSGIAYHADLGHLFLVGDDGRLAELDGSGRLLRSVPVRGNLEDVAVHTPSGDLMLLAEKRSELIRWAPATGVEVMRFPLEREVLLGRRPEGANDGFEGLAFREEPGRPGGGLFYLLHQRSPAMLVAVAFDPDVPMTVGATHVAGRYPLKPYKDLTAVTYVPDLDRLLVVADGRNQLLVVDTEGRIEREIHLPGRKQEGIGLDSRGDLWVADEQVGVLRLPGVLAFLRGRS
jgi:uncharacterized protein YjiK